MKIVADTNVLLRAAVRDDPTQTRPAAHALRTADLVAIPVAALCEFVWVMRSGYKRPPAEVAHSIRALIDSENVVTNRLTVEGDIAYEGEWLGAEEFVSFDKKAVSLLKSQGKRARLLS